MGSRSAAKAALLRQSCRASAGGRAGNENCGDSLQQREQGAGVKVSGWRIPAFLTGLQARGSGCQSHDESGGLDGRNHKNQLSNKDSARALTRKRVLE